MIYPSVADELESLRERGNVDATSIEILATELAELRRQLSVERKRCEEIAHNYAVEYQLDLGIYCAAESIALKIREGK